MKRSPAPVVSSAPRPCKRRPQWRAQAWVGGAALVGAVLLLPTPMLTLAAAATQDNAGRHKGTGKTLHSGPAQVEFVASYHGRRAWRMSRDGWAAILVPQLSRLMFFGPASGSDLGPNLLRENHVALKNRHHPVAKIWDEWPNFGGLVGWIGPQSGSHGWEAVTGREVPPASVDAKAGTAILGPVPGIVGLRSNLAWTHGVALEQTFELLPQGQLAVTARLHGWMGAGPGEHFYPWLVAQVAAPTSFEVQFRPGAGRVTPVQGGMPPGYAGDRTASASFGVSPRADHKVKIEGAHTLSALLGAHTLQLKTTDSRDTSAIYTSANDGYGELEAMGQPGGGELRILLSPVPLK